MFVISAEIDTVDRYSKV